MSIKADRNRIDWLSASLSTQKQRVVNLLRRVADLGIVQAMKPALFGKFIKLMDQVAVIRDEEMRILNEIEAIENKHRFQRKTGRLHHPKPKAAFNDNYEREKECDDEWDRDYEKNADIDDGLPNGMYAYGNGAVPNRPKHTLLWFVAFWYLMTRGGLSNKSQKLTAD